MIRATVKITGQQRLESLIPRCKEALKATFVELGKEAAAAQQELIESESKPDGSKQKEVTARTKAIKKHEGVSPNVPMYRTGRLANPLNWRIRKTKNGVSIRPPRDREAALYVMRRDGFVTVFDALPERIKLRLSIAVENAIRSENQ